MNRSGNTARLCYFALRRFERRNWCGIGKATATTIAATKLYSNPMFPRMYTVVNPTAAPIWPPYRNRGRCYWKPEEPRTKKDEMQLIASATIVNSGYTTYAKRL